MDKGVPIRSISRSIAVLQVINRLGALSMTAIGRHSGIPYPTACRIVQTLMFEGLIEQEPSRKRYRATALVKSLAHGYQPQDQLVDVGRDHLRDMTRKFGWPVSITVRVGSRMVVLDSTHGETSLTFERYFAGFTLPVMGSASGRLCLAFMTGDEREELVQWAPMSGETEAPLLDEAALQAVRTDGYAALDWGLHNRTPGKTSSIAVPIFREGVFESALTMIYFSVALRQEQAVQLYLPMLLDKARRISAALSAND
jgi:IclR family mhp operon transcriptional activator